jgi:hypothetical protein
MCDDGDPNTLDDVINANCECKGISVDGCQDGIQNGDEEGIDCGGNICEPCQPPIANCKSIEVTVERNHPDYDGQGWNDVWWIPAGEFDEGSTTSSNNAVIEIRRHWYQISFDWTTNGACNDIIPNGVLEGSDRGVTYQKCLPVSNADFNVWRYYELRIKDEFGISTCLGSFKVIPEGSSNDFVDDPDLIQRSSATDIPISVDDMPELGEMFIFPNPGNDYMQLNWRSEVDGPIVIAVSDINGRNVATHHSEVDNVQNPMVIDMSTEIAGVYIITVRSGNTQRMFRWLKGQ